MGHQRTSQRWFVRCIVWKIFVHRTSEYMTLKMLTKFEAKRFKIIGFLEGSKS